MRFLGSSGEAEGKDGSLVSRSGSAVIFLLSANSASLGHCAAGRERNILPKRPSKSEDRGVELSPRTPPPCAEDPGFFPPMRAVLIAPPKTDQRKGSLSDCEPLTIANAGLRRCHQFQFAQAG